mgnify:CR=1 FL=1
MNPGDFPSDLFRTLEGAVAFRLFADQVDPTLTVSEQIAARLGDRILSGAMAPGARIGEQELADEFAVSRGPIREALRILEREGLATLLPRVRLRLWPGASYHAARRSVTLTPADGTPMLAESVSA